MLNSLCRGFEDVFQGLKTRVCLGKVITQEGLIVTVFYFLFGVIRIITFTYIWYRLLAPMFAFAWDPEKKKSTPWWQDLGILVHFLATVIVYCAGSQTIPCWIPVYLMTDSFVYQSNVLWFDAIEFGLRGVEKKVWSARRIFFQAAVNFAESILLFAVLYQSAGHTDPFWSSLKSATTAGSMNSPFWPWQSGLSLFFILIVFSVMAPASSAGVRGRRGELAQWESDSFS